jgi:hypothetical protein
MRPKGIEIEEKKKTLEISLPSRASAKGKKPVPLRNDINYQSTFSPNNPHFAPA